MAKSRAQVHGAITSQTVPVAALQAHPRNYRQHPDAQLGRLQASIKRFGQVRSIVVQEGAQGQYLIVAGHGLVTAAQAHGLQELRADVIPATWTAQQVEGYLVADNETARGSFDDEALLAQILSEQRASGHDLASLGYSPSELDELMARLAATENKRTIDDAAGGGDDFDTTPVEEQGATRSKSGDLWELGAHRLLCGDSTRPDDVLRVTLGEKPFLMVTDPPYGVDYDAAWRDEAAAAGLISHAASRVAPVRNDNRVDWTEAWALFEGNVVYCWHADRHASLVQTSLETAGFEIRCQIVWAKTRFVISRGHYHWQHEPCWYAVRKGATACWSGDRSQTTLWEINLDKNVEGGHSTQKPLLCMAKPIQNHGALGDIVYDPFLGSGTTLIAAERLGRRCYGIEIDPRYCDVILRRWEAETGKTATLAHRSTQEVA